MNKVAAVCLLASLLAGCAAAAKIDARTEYQASTANYKGCLAANPSAPQSCESLRLAMEVDERKYNNLSAGAGGVQSSGAGPFSHSRD